MKALITCMLPALLLTACSAESARLTPLPAEAKVLAFGDSLTYGTGAPPGQGYPVFLSGLIARTVINAGVPGETTAGGKNRLPGILDRHRPALMLLCLGANDMLQGLDEKTAADNIRAMVLTARKQGIQIVIVGVPRPDRFAAPPEFYQEIASEFSLPYAKNVMTDVLKNPKLKSDFIHPNARGYRSIAEKLAEFLRKNGAI